MDRHRKDDVFPNQAFKKSLVSKYFTCNTLATKDEGNWNNSLSLFGKKCVIKKLKIFKLKFTLNFCLTYIIQFNPLLTRLPLEASHNLCDFPNNYFWNTLEGHEICRVWIGEQIILISLYPHEIKKNLPNPLRKVEKKNDCRLPPIAYDIPK